MKNWKYIFIRIFWAMLAIGAIILFIFSWKAKTDKKCAAIQIELVGNTSDNLFMNEQDIIKFINEQGIQIGTSIGSINLKKLEHSFDTIKWVEFANTYIDNQQQLHVKVAQKIPLARVFTVAGNSFYIDKTGQRLPLRSSYVMRLPVFTGFPSDQDKLAVPDSLLLNDILFFAKTIQEDSFFLVQMAQINIEPNGDFEIIPALGDHTVLLGSIENLEDKLNRLYTFYKKVWVPSGINAYQVLDLRFDHQVVALKKGVTPINYAAGMLPIIPLNPLIIDTVTEKIDTNKITMVKSTRAPVNNTIPKKLFAKNTKENVGKINTKTYNKINNNSLTQKEQSAKAQMPQKKASKQQIN